MTPRFAIDAINKKGILLVYPIENAKEPASLWSEAYPRSKMRWEWDEEGDNRVARLWHLRENLSRSKKVIYAKWYRGRATFFSRTAFRSLLCLFRSATTPLSRDAQQILFLLEESSPLSTKQIKKGVNLQGRLLESTYSRAMKELWSRLQICAFGEVDEGAFPSLAVGATSLLFEDLFLEAAQMSEEEAWRDLAPALESLPLKKFLHRALAASRCN